MAEDHMDRRKEYSKEPAPWTKLFGAFKIALDPKKLLLAGGGILVMCVGWYILSVIFFSTNSKRPDWNPASYPDSSSDDPLKRKAAWDQFKRERHQWYLLYEMAGAPAVRESSDGKTTADYNYIESDVADESYSPEEYEKKKANAVVAAKRYKPYGLLRVLPWFEDRGPNPYLLVTGGVQVAEGNLKITDYADWFVRSQLPVLLEPLFKFFQPIVFLFDPQAGFWNRVYLTLVILWSLATWAFFGGAITRIAAVQIARPNERLSLAEAVKFVLARYKAYLTAPIFPMLFLAVLTLGLIVFGLLEGNLGIIGDFLGPLLWPLALLVGLIMAVVLVGLVGWPLMYATISVEGSDSFDAISRSYSYVYQAPWHYLWYSLVAIAYGSVLVFFVGFMGSLMVHTTKWSIALAPTSAEREPSYLFRWAPTSFGWKDLLLAKSPHAETRSIVNTRGQKQPVTDVKLDTPPYEASWNNNIGAFLVSIWLYLVFLLIVGFGYSYFWTAGTIIYLLMRHKVDDTELDEIYLDEEPEQPFPAPAAPTTTNQPPPQMVETPQLRTPVAIVTPGSGPSAAAPSAEPVADAPRPDGSGPIGGGH
jgi:hypothetical protein